MFPERQDDDVDCDADGHCDPHEVGDLHQRCSVASQVSLVDDCYAKEAVDVLLKNQEDVVLDADGDYDVTHHLAIVKQNLCVLVPLLLEVLLWQSRMVGLLPKTL